MSDQCCISHRHQSFDLHHKRVNETIITIFETLKSGVKKCEDLQVLPHYEDLRNWEQMGQ